PMRRGAAKAPGPVSSLVASSRLSLPRGAPRVRPRTRVFRAVAAKPGPSNPGLPIRKERLIHVKRALPQLRSGRLLVVVVVLDLFEIGVDHVVLVALGRGVGVLGVFLLGLVHRLAELHRSLG